MKTTISYTDDMKKIVDVEKMKVLSKYEMLKSVDVNIKNLGHNDFEISIIGHIGNETIVVKDKTNDFYADYKKVFRKFVREVRKAKEVLTAYRK